MSEISQSPTQRLYRIVEEAMCTGCGLCQSLAGAENVEMCKVASGFERPVVVGELDDSVVDQIYQHCPGIVIEGMPQRLIASDSKYDETWGSYRRMTLGWASDARVRFEASTGGALTALATHLLASGEVDFVLHVKASQQHAIFGQRHLSFDAADVWEATGSRYGPAAPLIDILEILERNQPFAFIGKPCDIAALRNYARQDSRVDQLVKYWLAPVCGGFREPKAVEAYAAELGMAPDVLQHVRFRGRGCPGPTRFESTDGRVIERRYSDFWGEDEAGWSLPFRCKICPDGMAEGADLVAADSWPNCTVDTEAEAEDPGTNTIIARTVAGQALLQSAADARTLTLGKAITPRDMDSYQPHLVNKKQAAAARIEGLMAEGHLGIQHARLRLNRLGEAQGIEFNREQRDGTRQRVREGKASEACPCSGE
ncbi:Coenzyme F420 hydrogenase/dehydrogenase, beta subunit C-terminal domain [Marinobacterium jannaschii]|uniref:Coenzyme F420 hydrogenase/dehydrogenase, beta subunit C-terminal domain n=1 Tax=Marinobacterium jannaschii TaxID=64970 RepID=UPI000AA6AFFB|nr:Coenzyme F420 hydrogenase/dehydrogenase, beta subunit C-terminal domain [Marinobacterium jannaschii]